MKMDCTLDVKLDAFNKFSKAITSKGYVKVGILGNRARSSKSGVSNAEIGVVHEFGSKDGKIQPRSFLRMPLQSKGKWITDQMVSMKKQIEKAFSKGDNKIFFNKLAIFAEQAIDEAFETGGFGQWAPKNSRPDGKNSPLIVTGQLRGAIESQVVISGK
jgi:phage gpG-like protein